MIRLRPYQETMVAEVRGLMRQGVRSILATAPTGSGKTVLVSHMLRSATAKDYCSFFIVHRRELISQSTRTLAACQVPHGVIAASFPPEPGRKVQVCSVMSLARRLDRISKPKLLVWDECHHLAAGSWRKIYEAFPDAFHIGLTATPERLDGRGLGDFFKTMINGPSVAWLIENGFLSKYRIFAPGGGVNLEGIKSRMGEFIQSELLDRVDKPTITGDAIREYQRRCSGKRALVFCVSISHSKHVVDQFNQAGIAAEHVDGETENATRDAAISRFSRGETLVLSNVDLFGEGMDVPAIEAVIDIAPTQSLGRYLQRCGRALRPAEGKKEAIILDHAGNCMRHGLPDDEREWSLEGRDKRKSKSEQQLSVRICPQCFCAQFAGAPVCKECGRPFEIKARKVEEVDGDLEEISVETLRRNRAIEQGRAQSEKELVDLGRKRGYKRPELWARAVYRARLAKSQRG